MKFHYVVVLWGRQFTEVFLTAGLPSQLSPGNLPGVHARGTSRYRIFAPAEDLERIRRSRIFERLSSLIAVDLIEIDARSEEKKYRFVTKCHLRACNDAIGDDAWMLFICPDHVVADGTFTSLERLAGASYGAVMLMTVRVQLELALPEIRKRFLRRDGALCAPPRELVATILPRLHPVTKSLFWDAQEFGVRPSHTYWRLGDTAILGHGWHLHPIMFRPRALEREFITLDDDYVDELVTDVKDVYVSQDSDECLIIELSRAGITAEFPTEGRAAPEKVVRWGTGYLRPLHWHFFRFPILLHADGRRLADRRPDEVVAARGTAIALHRRILRAAKAAGRWRAAIGDASQPAVSGAEYVLYADPDAEPVTARVSVLIPTFERPEYLKKLLAYLLRQSGHFQVVILDSSARESHEASVGFGAMHGGRVTIRRFDPTIRFAEKLLDGLREVNTEYCVFCPDDDVLSVPALRQCLEFLDENHDYVGAHGLYIGFSERDDGFEVDEVVMHYPSLDQERSVDRVAFMLKDYKPNVYAVFRTRVHRQVFERVVEQDSSLFTEYLQCAGTAVFGKVARLPVIFQARQRVPSAREPVKAHTIQWFATDPEGYFRGYAAYREALLDLFCTDAATSAGYTRAQLGPIVDLMHVGALFYTVGINAAAVWESLAAHLAKQSPDQIFDRTLFAASGGAATYRRGIPGIRDGAESRRFKYCGLTMEVIDRVRPPLLTWFAGDERSALIECFGLLADYHGGAAVRDDLAALDGAIDNSSYHGGAAVKDGVAALDAPTGNPSGQVAEQPFSLPVPKFRLIVDALSRLLDLSPLKVFRWSKTVALRLGVRVYRWGMDELMRTLSEPHRKVLLRWRIRLSEARQRGLIASLHWIARWAGFADVVRQLSTWSGTVDNDVSGKKFSKLTVEDVALIILDVSPLKLIRLAWFCVLFATRVSVFAVHAIRYIVPATAIGLTVLLLDKLRIRFLPTYVERIGHLALETDCYVKAGILGIRPPYRTVMLASRERVSNMALLDYWRQHIHVVVSPVACRMLKPFAESGRLKIQTYYYTTAINETAAYPSIQARWGNRPPLLRLTDNHRERGARALRALGVPEGAWFVALHSREAGYSPSDDRIHDYRNTRPDDYLLAAKAIAERGGYCIRMGDPSSAPLPAWEGLIDYAHSDLRSDWMDIYLCAACRLFLGNTSGLYLVSSVFGVPAALANVVPMSTLPYGISDICIPKLIWSEREGRLLKFREIFDSPISNFRFSNLYTESEVRVIDNTLEEIRDLAIEALERIEGVANYDDRDLKLRDKYMHLFRPGHFSYGAVSGVGRDFLRKYVHLLD